MVWDLCDPDIPIDDLPEPLEEPYVPEYPEGGDFNEKKEWRDRIDVYKIKYAKWEKQARALGDVNAYIITHLNATHHLSLLRYKTPYQRLVYLQARFARSSAYEEEILLDGETQHKPLVHLQARSARSAVYEEEVRFKWKIFASQKPSKGADIAAWLTRWNNLREQAVRLKQDDPKSTNRDFLHATKEVLPLWWQARYQEIVMEGKVYETKDLVESFRAMYRELGPNLAQRC